MNIQYVGLWRIGMNLKKSWKDMLSTANSSKDKNQNDMTNDTINTKWQKYSDMTQILRYKIRQVLAMFLTLKWYMNSCVVL